MKTIKKNKSVTAEEPIIISVKDVRKHTLIESHKFKSRNNDEKYLIYTVLFICLL